MSTTTYTDSKVKLVLSVPPATLIMVTLTLAAGLVWALVHPAASVSSAAFTLTPVAVPTPRAIEELHALATPVPVLVATGPLPEPVPVPEPRMWSTHAGPKPTAASPGLAHPLGWPTLAAIAASNVLLAASLLILAKIRRTPVSVCMP